MRAGIEEPAGSRLHRLERALAALGTDRGEGGTDAIAQAAKEALDATAVLVLVPRDDLPGSLQRANGAGLPDDLRQVLRTALRRPEDSPSGQALRTGAPVLVPDLAADARFSWAAPTLAHYGGRSLIAVPFGPGGAPIGVLNAYFDRTGPFGDDEVAILRAFAVQASSSVACAIAADRERRAEEELAHAERLRSDFLSTVSHELRTPLTSIAGFVDTVILQWDRLDDSSKQELLQRVSWNAGELRRLIEQVLAFSSLEATARDAQAPYALRRGIDDVVRHMTPALRECEVEVDIDDDVVILASPEVMHHVIGNLLTNASKFSPAGSRIQIAGRRAITSACITVTDEGPGVPEGERDRIFDRFYRGATTGHTRGTGIGLAIVRTSVEAMGGTVDVRDHVAGRGATFEVTLPLADEAGEASVLVL